MQRNGKGPIAAPHDDVIAALTHAFKTVFDQQIAQLRAGKDAQLRHALLQAL